MEIIAEGFKGEKAITVPANIRNQQLASDICKKMYLTHIGYYPDAKHHFRERTSGASENVLIYCIDGKGWVEHNEERHILKRHHVYIIPKDEAHSYGSIKNDPWSIFWLHFDGEDVELFNSIIGEKLALDNNANSRLKDRMSLFEEIFRNLEMGYQSDNLEHITFCLMYFFSSLKYVAQYRELNTIHLDDSIQKAIMYMKDNLENKLSLDDIASAVGYSKSHLSTLFLDKTSSSPMAYYNQLRIQRACMYLQFSDLKIKEISFRLGYYDPYHFSKAFFSEMEISPRDYRKNYNESPSKKRDSN